MTDRTHSNISNMENATPESNIYMFDHIGGIESANADINLDRDSQYTNEQQALINKQNNTLYKREPHNSSFDLPQSAYNHISKVHPLGVNMVSNHGDRGFDYRDYPFEIEKDKTAYDPYIGYLHKNGLIGRNKSRYTVHHINIDSADRNKTARSKTSYSVRLDSDPMIFNGNLLRIYIPNTEVFTLNDKINISGVFERELTIRSVIQDDFGNTINYFATEETKQYMTVMADTNMNINSGFTPEIKDQYTDTMVDMSGFTGDRKTEWYFDLRSYLWEFIPNVLPDIPGYTLRIVENVHGVTVATSLLPEDQQIPSHMLIAEFKIDVYGTVYEITQGVPYRADNVRWTTPPDLPLQPPQSVPESYYTESINLLTSLNLNITPSVPTSIYRVMEYFDKVQNAIRPIFFSKMNTLNSNFSTRYEESNETYQTSVRIVVPEATKISSTTTIGNMSLNLLNSKHRMYFTSADVERDLGIYDSSTSTSTDIPNANRFYIKLDYPFKKRVFEFSNPLLSGALLIKVYNDIKSDVTIKYHHYGGVPNNMINSDYPTGFKSIDSFKYVIDVNNSYIVIDVGRVGLLDKRFGGDSVYISLIEDIEIDYPYPYQYVVNLDKVYTNVVMVKMISSCFPLTQKVFMNGLTGGRQNNRFYWQNIDDGNTIYMIEIDPGNYSPQELKILLEKEISLIPRMGDTIVTTVFNNIVIDIDEKSGKVVFTSYNVYTPEFEPFISKTLLSTINCSTNSDLIPEDELYYQYPFGEYFKNFANDPNSPSSISLCDSLRIKISHPNHSVTLGQTITISGSLNYDDIPASYINGQHIVTRVDSETYDILLTGINYDANLEQNAGGSDVTIKTPNKFRIRFDFTDTFGRELGFRNTGEETSITPYQYVITNDTPYDGEYIPFLHPTNGLLDTTAYIRRPLNFDGPSYILISCDELQQVKNLGTIKDFFYRIDLKRGQIELGRYVYNTFVDTPIILNDVLNRLNKLTINIYSPDGTFYDFNGVDHSYMLEIVTFDEIPEGTSLTM